MTTKTNNQKYYENTHSIKLLLARIEFKLSEHEKDFKLSKPKTKRFYNQELTSIINRLAEIAVILTNK